MVDNWFDKIVGYVFGRNYNIGDLVVHRINNHSIQKTYVEPGTFAFFLEGSYRCVTDTANQYGVVVGISKNWVPEWSAYTAVIKFLDEGPNTEVSIGNNSRDLRKASFLEILVQRKFPKQKVKALLSSPRLSKY